MAVLAGRHNSFTFVRYDPAMDYCNDNARYYAHCLDCGEHFERRYGHNGSLGCLLCASNRKALHEVDCVYENACQDCLSGLTSDERRGMFYVVLGGKQ